MLRHGGVRAGGLPHKESAEIQDPSHSSLAWLHVQVVADVYDKICYIHVTQHTQVDNETFVNFGLGDSPHRHPNGMHRKHLNQRRPYKSRLISTFECLNQV